MFGITRYCNERQFSSVDKWVTEMCNVPKMEDYSAIKMYEVLIQATTWKALGNIMLRDGEWLLISPEASFLDDETF